MTSEARARRAVTLFSPHTRSALRSPCSPRPSVVSGPFLSAFGLESGPLHALRADCKERRGTGEEAERKENNRRDNRMNVSEPRRFPASVGRSVSGSAVPLHFLHHLLTFLVSSRPSFTTFTRAET